MGSNAVSQNIITSVIGYELLKGYFNTSSPNLPQNISILAEANTANQSGLSTNAQVITSAQQAANLYGYGSPIHGIARILFPLSGSNVPIPVTVYPQLAAVSSIAKVLTITATGTATNSGTIYLVVNGRETIDGGSYAVNIAKSDTPTIIAGKIVTTLSSVLGAPVTATSATGVVTCTAKWTGLTSNDINISIDLNGTNLGVTYAVATTAAGVGTPSTTGSGNGTALFGSAWNTIVINSYGLVATTMAELELYNGAPDNDNPTGQYSGTIWRPMIALSGTCLDDPTSITSERSTACTIVTCVAPLSLGMPYEIAGNVAYLIANQFQNNPQGDILGQSYPDMPPAAVGVNPQMNSLAFRNECVTSGCSTVLYTGGIYQIADLVTTYDPAGEVPPFYRYARDLNIYWNMEYGYYLLVVANLVGKTITSDNTTTTATNVIKPKLWAGIVANYLTDAGNRALIANVETAQKSIVVTISTVNPNRLETTYSYQITGIARVIATSVTAGFNFGG